MGFYGELGKNTKYDLEFRRLKRLQNNLVCGGPDGPWADKVIECKRIDVSLAQ